MFNIKQIVNTPILKWEYYQRREIIAQIRKVYNF